MLKKRFFAGLAIAMLAILLPATLVSAQRDTISLPHETPLFSEDFEVPGATSHADYDAYLNDTYGGRGGDSQTYANTNGGIMYWGDYNTDGSDEYYATKDSGVTYDYGDSEASLVTCGDYTGSTDRTFGVYVPPSKAPTSGKAHIKFNVRPNPNQTARTSVLSFFFFAKGNNANKPKPSNDSLRQIFLNYDFLKNYKSTWLTVDLYIDLSNRTYDMTVVKTENLSVVKEETGVSFQFGSLGGIALAQTINSSGVEWSGHAPAIDNVYFGVPETGEYTKYGNVLFESFSTYAPHLRGDIPTTEDSSRGYWELADTAIMSDGSLEVGHRSGMTVSGPNLDKETCFVVPHEKQMPKGKFIIEFMFKPGTNVNNDWVYFYNQGGGRDSIVDLSNHTKYVPGTWYKVHIELDKDAQTVKADTYSADGLTQIGSNIQQTSSWRYELAKVAFRTRSAHSMTAANNKDGCPTEIDNFSINWVDSGNILSESFNNTFSTTYSSSNLAAGGWDLSGTAAFSTGFGGTNYALAPAYGVGTTPKTSFSSSEYHIPQALNPTNGQLRFCFKFYKGTYTSKNLMCISYKDEWDDLSLTDILDFASCPAGEWYWVDFVWDADTKMYNARIIDMFGNDVVTTKGTYDHDKIGYLSMRIKANGSSGTMYEGESSLIDDLSIISYTTGDIADIQFGSTAWWSSGTVTNMLWDDSIPYSFITARYRGSGTEELSQMKFLGGNAGSNKITETDTASLELTSATGYTYRAFLWNGITGMKPLATHKEKTR